MADIIDYSQLAQRCPQLECSNCHRTYEKVPGMSHYCHFPLLIPFNADPNEWMALVFPIPPVSSTAEGWRCFECNAPLGHSRSCSHFDGYTPDEMQEHLEDSEV